MPDWGTIEPSTGSTYGDWSQQFQYGMYGLGESLVGLAREYGGPSQAIMMAPTQRALRERREAQVEEMTPGGREQFQSEIFSPEFYRSPIGWAVAQGIGTSPYLAASIIPTIGTGGLAGLGVGALTSGVLTDADMTSSVQEIVDGLGEEELQKNPTYANAILKGGTDADARQAVIDEMLGPGAHVTAVALGAASAALGLERIAGGAAGRVLGREVAGIPQVRGGVARGALKEGAIGAVTEYGEEFGTEALVQAAERRGRFRDEYDIGAMHRAGATGAVIGGPLGAVGGAVERFGKGAEEAKPSTAPPPPSVQAATTQPTGPTVGGTTPPSAPGGTRVVQPTAKATQFTPAQPLTRSVEGVPEVWKGVLREPVSGVTPRQTPGAIPEVFAGALGEKPTPVAPVEPEINRRVPGAEPTPPPTPPRTPFKPAGPTPPRGGPTPPPQIRTPPRTPPGLGGAIPETGRTVLSDPIGPSPEVSVALSEKTQAAPPTPEEGLLIGNQRPGIQPPVPGPLAAAPPIGTPPPQIATPPRVGPAEPPVRPAQGVVPSMPPARREMRPAPEFQPPPPVQGPPPAGPTREIGRPPVYGPPIKSEYWKRLKTLRPKAFEELNSEEKAALMTRWKRTTGKKGVEEFPGTIEEILESELPPAMFRDYLKAVNQATTERAQITIQKAALKKLIDEEIATGVQPEVTPRELTGHKSKAQIEKEQVIDPAKAKVLFEKHTAPENVNDGVLETRNRMQKIMDDVKKEDIKITRVDKHTPNHMMWLAEVKSLHSRGSEASLRHVKEFLLREYFAVVENDFSPMREGRSFEGMMGRKGGGARAEAMGEEEAAAGGAERAPLTGELVAERGEEQAAGVEAPVRLTEQEAIEEEEREGPSEEGEEEGEEARIEATTAPKSVRGSETFSRKSIKELWSMLPPTSNVRKAVEDILALPRKEDGDPNGLTTEQINNKIQKAFETAPIKGRPRERTVWGWKQLVGEAFEKAKAEVREPELYIDIPARRQKLKSKKAEREGMHPRAQFFQPAEVRAKPRVGPKGFQIKLRVKEKQFKAEAFRKKQREKAEAEEAKKLERIKGIERERVSKEQQEATLAEIAKREYKEPSAAPGPEVKLTFGKGGVTKEEKVPTPEQKLTREQIREITFKGLQELEEKLPPKTPLTPREQGARAAQAGKPIESNPYKLTIPVLPTVTAEQVRAYGLRGTEIEAYLREASIERADKLRALTERYKIRAAQWNAGYRAAKKATAEQVVLKSTKPEPPKAKAIKQRSVEQRRVQARMQIDKNATPAQREAGNARGGLLNWQGLEVMLQYAKGMKRFGTKLLNDYGHIKRTIGADNNPIDIYLGPNLSADTVYVIDQVDPISGRFDEHKVMAGFDSAIDAQVAFVNQVGRNRYGDMTPMSMDQFKEWVYKDYSRPTRKRETLRLKFSDNVKLLRSISNRTDVDEMAARRWNVTPLGKHTQKGDTFTNGIIQIEVATKPFSRKDIRGDVVTEYQFIVRDLHTLAGESLARIRLNDYGERIDIGSVFAGKNVSDETTANVLGPETMRMLVDFAGQAFPNAKKLRGVRVSGARAAAKKPSVSWEDVGGGFSDMEIPLRRRQFIDEMRRRPAGVVINGQKLSAKSMKGMLTRSVPDTLTEFTATGREAYTQLVRRIEDTIENTPVFVLDPNSADQLGVTSSGFYDPREDIIVLRALNDQLGVEADVILHEATHAALVKATWQNPELRKVLTQIAREFRDGLNASGITEDFYAFKNVDEFIAELISNQGMRERLAQMAPSQELSNLYDQNVQGRRPFTSLLQIIYRAIKEFLGLVDTLETDNLLNVALGTTSQIQTSLLNRAPGPMTEHDLLMRRGVRNVDYLDPNIPWTGEDVGSLVFPLEAGAVRDFTKGMVGDVIDRFRPTEIKQRSIWLASFRGMDQLAQVAKDFGEPFAKAARQVANAFERMRVRAHDITAEHYDFMKRWENFKYKHRSDGVYEQLGRYMIAETEARIRGDIPLEQQPHVGEGVTSAWARSQHPKLKAMWDALPADAQALRTESMNLTKSVQEKMALGVLKNQIFAVLGVEANNALLHKLLKKEELTPAEKDQLATTSKGDKLTKAQSDEFELAIKNTRALTSYKGPYYPEMRFGNFVVTGTYKFNEPASAKRIIDPDGSESDHTFEFTNENDAKAYAATQDPYTTITSSYVDENGNTTYVDLESNLLRNVTKEDAARRNFRVHVSNRVVEFFDSHKEALDAAAKMKKDDNFTLSHAGVREFDPDRDSGRELLANDVRRLISSLEKHPAYQNATADERRAMKQSLVEMSLRFYGPTSIQSRRRPRRHVKGASIDFHTVMGQYVSSSSGYLAKLEVDPDLQAGLRAMDDNISGDEYNMNARQQIFNEMSKRVTNPERQKPPTNLDIITNRIMAWTFINFLGSPSYSVNNSLQVAMVGAPHLAARHGLGATARMLYKVYKQVGVGKIIKAGAKGMATAIQRGRTNFLEEMVARLPNPRHKEMIEYLRVNGTIAPEAGLEFVNSIETTGPFGKATDILQQVARSMPAAVETMNRVVMGIAAYDLEYAKNGGNHQAAMEYAQEAVNLTQGNYSRTNMPTFFHKNPLYSIAFQFKNYGQTIYGNIGHNIGKIIRNSPDKGEAALALTYLAGSHILMAGLLGLPTEPIRWLLTAANMVGLTNIQWDEAENAARQLNAYLFGDYVGELLSRGLPRAIGIDVSERLGAQNLLTYGMPRDDSEESWYAYYGSMIFGAAGATTLEMKTGLNDIRNGDIAQGMQKIAPIKVLSDSINAYRQFTEGKKTGAGYQVYGPINPVEAFLTAFGYKTAQQAETSEASQYFYAAQRRVSEERNDLQRRWNKAVGAEKFRIMKRIRDFNRGRSIDEQLTQKDLNNYAKSWRARENVGGILINRRNRALAQTLGIYNTE